MKRKVLAAVMAGLMLCLSGCSAVEVESVTEESSEQSLEQSLEQSGSIATEEEIVNTPSGYLDVDVSYHYDSLYEEASLVYGHYGLIFLESDEFPKLTLAVNTYNESCEKESQEYFNKIKEQAADEYKEIGKEMFMGPYVYEADTYIRRADTQVLSAVEKCYSYEGGAHGNHYFNSVNFDVQTGEKITLDTVIKEEESLYDILATEVKEKYPDLTFWSDDLTGMMKGYITPFETEYDLEPTWTVDYEGVTFYFNDYELTSYADGVQQILVSYSEYPQIFHEKYFSNITKDYVIPLNDSNICSDIDLTGDGTTDYIQVAGNYQPEYEMYDSLTVDVNGNAYTLEQYYYELQTYFVKAGNDNYLYIQRRSESDFQSVSVFKITEKSVEYVGDFTNQLLNFTNSSDFKVAKRMDLLSTYFATADCSIGEDGMPVEKNGIYKINAELSITSAIDITAELVDDKGALAGTTWNFPAGTDFRFLETDGVTYVDMQASDGQKCRFYTTPDWPATVNGMDAESCFEMLWYAG